MCTFKKSKKNNMMILLLLFILITFYSHSYSQAWNSCPFGLEDDPYPGECGRYIDTNEDGICDLSQPKPENNQNNDHPIASIIPDNNMPIPPNNHTSHLPEEEDYSVEISGNQLKNMTIVKIARLWEIDADTLLIKLKENLLLKNEFTIHNSIQQLREEIRFSPSLVKMVAEEIKMQGMDLEKISLQENVASGAESGKSENFNEQKIIFPDYNLLEIGLITLLIYLGGKWLARRLNISIVNEKRFWNIVLLLSFIGSAGTGFILILIRDFNWFHSINLNFLFWHVEFSIAMGLIGIFHALWHIKYYSKIFYKK